MLYTKQHSDETISYYETHAAEFCRRTASVDMSVLYTPFLAEIPDCGRILDAGCGSGRDSHKFLRKGYQVVSIDASAKMVEATTALTGQKARLVRFEALEFDSEFDGIWACASLLHVQRSELDNVLARLTKALKPNAVLYVSFKLGDRERVEAGRYFNDMNEMVLKETLLKHVQLEFVRIWTSDDIRSEPGQCWLNAIVRRKG